jgi:hypothetical protein
MADPVVFGTPVKTDPTGRKHAVTGWQRPDDRDQYYILKHDQSNGDLYFQIRTIGSGWATETAVVTGGVDTTPDTDFCFNARSDRMVIWRNATGHAGTKYISADGATTVTTIHTSTGGTVGARCAVCTVGPRTFRIAFSWDNNTDGNFDLYTRDFDPIAGTWGTLTNYGRPGSPGVVGVKAIRMRQSAIDGRVHIIATARIISAGADDLYHTYQSGSWELFASPVPGYANSQVVYFDMQLSYKDKEVIFAVGADYHVGTPPLSRMRFYTRNDQQIWSETVIDDHVESSATANAGDTVTLTDINLPSNTDDFYNGLSIRILDGASAGNNRTVSDYDAATKTLTVSVAFDSAIVIGVAYQIGTGANTPQMEINTNDDVYVIWKAYNIEDGKTAVYFRRRLALTGTFEAAQIVANSIGNTSTAAAQEDPEMPAIIRSPVGKGIKEFCVMWGDDDSGTNIYVTCSDISSEDDDDEFDDAELLKLNTVYVMDEPAGAPWARWRASTAVKSAQLNVTAWLALDTVKDDSNLLWGTGEDTGTGQLAYVNELLIGTSDNGENILSQYPTEILDMGDPGMVKMFLYVDVRISTLGGATGLTFNWSLDDGLLAGSITFTAAGQHIKSLPQLVGRSLSLTPTETGIVDPPILQSYGLWWRPKSDKRIRRSEQ